MATKIYKFIYIYIYIYIYNKQTSINNATEIGDNKEIEFADFGVFKARQFSKFNVK